MSGTDLTIAIVGQVKSGKSSLANCLLGDQRAAVEGAHCDQAAIALSEVYAICTDIPCQLDIVIDEQLPDKFFLAAPEQNPVRHDGGGKAIGLVVVGRREVPAPRDRLIEARHGFGQPPEPAQRRPEHPRDVAVGGGRSVSEVVQRFRRGGRLLQWLDEGFDGGPEDIEDGRGIGAEEDGEHHQRRQRIRQHMAHQDAGMAGAQRAGGLERHPAAPEHQVALALHLGQALLVEPLDQARQPAEIAQAGLHLGQHDMAAGVVAALRRDDTLASNHRGHGHARRGQRVGRA